MRGNSAETVHHRVAGEPQQQKWTSRPWNLWRPQALVASSECLPDACHFLLSVTHPTNQSSSSRPAIWIPCDGWASNFTLLLLNEFWSTLASPISTELSRRKHIFLSHHTRVARLLVLPFTDSLLSLQMLRGYIWKLDLFMYRTFSWFSTLI
jgi:hypothetical protein